MTIDITLRSRPALVIVTFHDLCSLTDILNTLAHIRGDPRVRAMTPRIWDLRTARFRMSTQDIRSIVSWLRRRSPREQPPQIPVIVHQQTVTYGLLRMLQTYMELAEVPTVLRLCATPADALRWLGLEPDILDMPEA
jgi:hypothetical protein